MEEPSSPELILVSQLHKRLEDLDLAKGPMLEAKNLVRFLRARNHSMDNTEVMFRKYIQWRKENDMDHILEWEVPPEYKTTYWPWSVTGYDHLGNPVVMLPQGSWDPAWIGKIGYDIALRYCYQCLEVTFNHIQHVSKDHPAMKQFTVIFDMKGLGIRHLTTVDAVKAGMEMFRCFEANYPETLRVAYFVNIPTIFNAVFKMVKPFLSEKTQGKMQFLGGSDPAQWRTEMSEVMAPDQFPQRYGGDLPDSVEIDVHSS